MIVNAYLCPRCDSLVFSRARHDYRRCPCGDIAVDGGTDYTRLTYKHSRPKQISYEVNLSIDELYNDWNHRDENYGLVLDYSKTKDTSGTGEVP